MTIIGRIRRIFRCMALDPVTRCDVFKRDGCAHVDGLLCDFPKCSIRHDAKTLDFRPEKA